MQKRPSYPRSFLHAASNAVPGLAFRSWKHSDPPRPVAAADSSFLGVEGMWGSWEQNDGKRKSPTENSGKWWFLWYFSIFLGTNNDFWRVQLLCVSRTPFHFWMGRFLAATHACLFVGRVVTPLVGMMTITYPRNQGFTRGAQFVAITMRKKCDFDIFRWFVNFPSYRNLSHQVPFENLVW